MNKPVLSVIKIGGHVIDDEQALQVFIAKLAAAGLPFVLVHGGGKAATALSSRLGISTQLVQGRRITDAQTLDVAVMVYAGLVNKKIVAMLQAQGQNAIGLCGADANLVPAQKRQVQQIDYGFVGDVDAATISVANLRLFLGNNLCPVIAPITHDGTGQLLNTNADTVASSLAIALSEAYEVSLVYCFEKDGVLADATDERTVIRELGPEHYRSLTTENKIHSGMIPKLDQAFSALQQGVSEVYIINANRLNQFYGEHGTGTKLVK